MAVKLLLVDGYYYAYRSFHALVGLKNPQGEPIAVAQGSPVRVWIPYPHADSNALIARVLETEAA